MFKNPFSFEGRIRRTEYGLSYIFYTVTILLISSVAGTIGKGGEYLNFAIIPAIWFILAQGAKRCHDRGNSGWYLIIPFYVLWMLFADSQYGENEYGPNPKGIGNYKIIDEIGQHLTQ
jgi:uncharacterized membrane protein YhaH (DUF805 family)